LSLQAFSTLFPPVLQTSLGTHHSFFDRRCSGAGGIQSQNGAGHRDYDFGRRSARPGCVLRIQGPGCTVCSSSWLYTFFCRPNSRLGSRRWLYVSGLEIAWTANEHSESAAVGTSIPFCV